MSENIEILNKIRQADTILLAAHIRPDGDAVGSTLGFGLSLLEAGKKVQMVLNDSVPRVFHYLKGFEKIKTKQNGGHDLSIVLDCSDLKRTGTIFDNICPDINIDHHITNEKFAKINLVRTDACATASILAENLPVWGLPVNKDVANALLTGIVSDTLGFRTSNVTPKTLKLAAELIEKGADLSEIYYRNLITRTYEAARYWGSGLINLNREEKFVWTSLTLEDRKEAEYSGNDDADLINILSSIENIPVSLIFIEQNNDQVKVSWRAKCGYDVSQIALKFGGGGHPAAAGATIDGKLDKIKKMVLEETRLFVENSLDNL